MERLSVQTTAPKPAGDPAGDLAPAVFQRPLNWLDAGLDSQGQSYLRMRQRLITYFDRKNCLAPDELADETLNRVARRLDEENTISSDTPAHYCYIVARYVFMEYLREKQRREIAFDAVFMETAGNPRPPPELEDEKANREKLMTCLDRCTEKLEPLKRDLIIRYYIGEQRVKIENRRSLAAALGLTINALSIRACRIRRQLETCIESCVGKHEMVLAVLSYTVEAFVCSLLQ